MILTWIKVCGLAHDAGFRGEPLSVATAIVGPESGREPEAVHLNSDGSIDRGLWQINSVHLGPDGLLEGWDPALLFDPAVNARAAWIVSGQGRSFQPWNAYKHGLHEPSLDAARVAMDARSIIAGRDIQIGRRDTRITQLEGQIATAEASLQTTQQALVALRHAVAEHADQLKGLVT